MPPVTPSAMRAMSTPNYQLPISDLWELGVGDWMFQSSTFTTLRRRISFCAIAIFLFPSSRGTAPLSSCRVRLPARTTNSNRFSLGARSTIFFQAGLKVRLYVHVSLYAHVSRRSASASTLLRRGGLSGPPAFERRND